MLKGTRSSYLEVSSFKGCKTNFGTKHKSITRNNGEIRRKERFKRFLPKL